VPPPDSAAAKAAALQDSEPGLPVVPVRTPAQFITLVPYLLGYHPAEGDLVLVGTIPPRGRVKLTLRLGLPAPPGGALAAARARHAVALLAAQDCATVTVVGYGPDSILGPAAAAAREAATAAGLELRDLLRVDGGRWWSYLCTDPACCPPDGTPCQPDPAVTVPFDEAGAPVLPGRDALGATIAPVTGAEADSMTRATARAVQRRSRLARREQAPGRKSSHRPVEISGTRAVAAAIRACRDGGSITSNDQAAWLTVALTEARVRDAALTRMDAQHRDAHQRLWAGLTRLARPGYVAAPATLLALTAWQSGNGALGQVALDRALTDKPGDPLALILRDALDIAAPPALANPRTILRQPRHPA
jgi:hypothetical protein